MSPSKAPTSLPAHQHAGYEAVYEVIRAEPGDAWRNAIIWRAVEAYRLASEAEHERQVREKVAAEIEAEYRRPDGGLARGPMLRAAEIARGGA